MLPPKSYSLGGANLNEPHTSVVYGNTLFNRPTNCVHPSHVILICCTCPHCHVMPRLCAWWWTVQCIVVIVTRSRMATMGRRKAETPVQRTARLEWERESSKSHFLVGVAILHMRQFFSPVASHKLFFTLFYIKHSTCTPHSGQDLHMHNPYGHIHVLCFM